MPPGDRYLEVAEASVDQDWMVAAQVQCAGDPRVVDLQGAGGVQEVPPDPVRGGVLVSGQLEGEQPVEVAGDDSQRGVEVDVERDTGGERVQVESADVGVQLVFDHHPLGVAGEQVFGGGGEVVGDQQGGLVAADAADGDLADPGADAGELDHVFVQAGPPVAAGPGDGDGLPRGCG